MVLLMRKQTVLRNGSTRRDLYVFVLLRLDIVKNSICIVFLPFDFINVVIFVTIHLAFIQHSLEQIQITPIRYVLTEAADLT